MSTLPLRATQAPQVWPIPGLARLGAFLSLIAEVYADAQQSMREANKKYPFAGV
ncbi:MAG: hypothetical protein Q8M24_20690 [Pseudolabrys sp.]|nr:hypothetical protein [Pseudolabrys sp.]MDP2297870.1 hypothetical protein [Pseudolabrys sp.]